MNRITKEIFLSSISCPTLGWIISHTKSSDVPLSLYDKFKIEEGLEIHKRARTLFPDGVLVEGKNIDASMATHKLLLDPTISTIFEATFLVNPYITKADIIIHQSTGYKILEVKSNVNMSEELIDDLAYTTMVSKKAGLDITSCSLLLVSKDYRLGMSDEKLFKEIDVTDEVFDRVEEFIVCCDEVIKVEVIPKPSLGG